MSNEQPGSNNTIGYRPSEYKSRKCIARNCENNATCNIKLAIVNGSGDFCTFCSKYFEERDLVVSCSVINLEEDHNKRIQDNEGVTR
jgi:hypothetical protein